MEERVLHGQLGRRRRVRLGPAVGRLGRIVQYGLRDSPEDHADAHPRLKKHREPREQAKLGLLVLLTQLDLTVTAEGQKDNEA